MNNQQRTSNGVNHWLSRRHPRYVRSLVYMLQASEYNIADFFKWHERVSDFRFVEKRKRLVFTPKAVVLLIAGWAGLCGALVLAVLIFASASSFWSYLLALAVLFEPPLIVLATLIFAVIVLRLLQLPAEALLLAQAKRRLAAHRGIKIAIAGSFGKTSTREILRTVLSERRKVAAPKDSYNTPLGIAKFVQSLKGDEEVLIFELGEYYPGDIRKLARMIRPDWGIITGVNEAHLEKFGSLERTADTVFELAERIDATRLYVNGESPRALARVKDGNIIYTREGAGTWNVVEARTDLSGTNFKISNGKQAIEGISGLLGLHMLAPLALAADIASRLGLSNEEIQRGLEKTRPFAHRLQPMQWADGVTFLDDSYNGNPDGVHAVIAFLASLPGRRFYVTPGLVEAGPRLQEVHEQISAQIAEAGIEKVALIRNSVTPHVENGLKKAGFKGDILWYEDMPACLAALRALTLPGDVILIQNDWPDQYA